jgi:hypothetical protein
MTDAEWIDQACVLIGEAAGELERPRKGLAQDNRDGARLGDTPSRRSSLGVCPAFRCSPLR